MKVAFVLICKDAWDVKEAKPSRRSVSHRNDIGYRENPHTARVQLFLALPTADTGPPGLDLTSDRLQQREPLHAVVSGTTCASASTCHVASIWNNAPSRWRGTP